MTRIVPSDRVLVRMPSWLGDFVMAEPVLNALLEPLYPGRTGNNATNASWPIRGIPRYSPPEKTAHKALQSAIRDLIR